MYLYSVDKNHFYQRVFFHFELLHSKTCTLYSTGPGIYWQEFIDHNHLHEAVRVVSVCSSSGDWLSKKWWSYFYSFWIWVWFFLLLHLTTDHYMAEELWLIHGQIPWKKVVSWGHEPDVLTSMSFTLKVQSLTWYFVGCCATGREQIAKEFKSKSELTTIVVL